MINGRFLFEIGFLGSLWILTMKILSAYSLAKNLLKLSDHSKDHVHFLLVSIWEIASDSLQLILGLFLLVPDFLFDPWKRLLYHRMEQS